MVETSSSPGNILVPIGSGRRSLSSVTFICQRLPLHALAHSCSLYPYVSIMSMWSGFLSSPLWCLLFRMCYSILQIPFPFRSEVRPRWMDFCSLGSVIGPHPVFARLRLPFLPTLSTHPWGNKVGTVSWWLVYWLSARSPSPTAWFTFLIAHSDQPVLRACLRSEAAPLVRSDFCVNLSLDDLWWMWMRGRWVGLPVRVRWVAFLVSTPGTFKE